MMKISCLLFATFILHAVASSELLKRVKPTAPIPRPASFASDVNGLISDMAKANKYDNGFDRCHIIPWHFLRDMINKYNSKQINKSKMKTFINDLSQIHKSATYYVVLELATRNKLKNLVAKYLKEAHDALDDGKTKELASKLYNMPSNLYPGDPTNNRSIKNNIDAPKEDSGGRTTTASAVAQRLFRTYRGLGLTMLSNPDDPSMAKTSDKPPGDTTGDYVTI